MTAVKKGNTEVNEQPKGEKTVSDLLYPDKNEDSQKDVEHQDTDKDQDDSQNKDTEDKKDTNEKKDDKGLGEDSKSDKKSEKDKDSDKQGETELFGKPEAGYDYKDIQLPEGMTLQKENTDKFNALAEKLNLSQKGANELMTLAVEHTKHIQTSLGDAFAQTQKEKTEGYKKELEKDPEIGGVKLKETLEVANIAYEKLSNNTVQDLLLEAGLNHHPEIVRMFYNMGKFMQDDKIRDGKNPSKSPQTAKDILYPDMNKEEKE